MAEGTAKKLRQRVEQEWAPGCPDPQERCELTDVPQRVSASLVKLHIKADNVTPASS